MTDSLKTSMKRWFKDNLPSIISLRKLPMREVVFVSSSRSIMDETPVIVFI